MTNPITSFFKKLLFVPPTEDSFVSIVTELAERTGQSKAEVLRNALNMYYGASMLPEQDLILLKSLVERLKNNQGIDDWTTPTV
jgi:hypothetical protein